MKKKCYLIIDYHYGNMQVYLLDAKGTVLSSAQQAISIRSSQLGWQDYDPLDITYSLRSAINQAIQKKKKTEFQIESIGVVTDGHSCLIWDSETGAPLTPAVPGTCIRANNIISKFVRDGLSSQVKSTTGLNLLPTYIGPKLKWFMESIPDLYYKGVKDQLMVGGVDSWILYNLTGRKLFKTDCTHASQTMLYDIHNLQWDSFLVNECLIKDTFLPDVQDSQSDFGETFGFVPLVDGIPIQLMMVSGQAIAQGSSLQQLGDGVVLFDHPGHVMVNMGQDIKRLDSNDIEVSLMKTNDTTTYYLKTQVPFPNLNESVLRSPENFNEAEYDLTLENNYGIQWISHFKSQSINNTIETLNTIFGVTPQTKFEHLLRAFYESFAYQTKQTFLNFEDQLGIILKELKIAGVLKYHPFLMQYQADILQVPLVRYKQPLVRVMGAFLTLLSSYNKVDYDKSIKSILSVDKSYLPEMDPITSLALYNEWKSYYDKVYQLQST